MQPSYPTLFHRWIEEVWNQGRTETIEELFLENSITHGLSDGDAPPLIGVEPFKQFYLSRRGAFPDVHIEIQDWTQSGEIIWIRCQIRGTHTGDALGIPPTGLRVELPGVTIAHIQNGKIVESWNYFDFVPYYVRLGIMEFKPIAHPAS